LKRARAGTATTQLDRTLIARAKQLEDAFDRDGPAAAEAVALGTL
jgi:hypothetical protein